MKLKFFFAAVIMLVPVFASANVIINEVAWMGTSVSASNEWMELYNNGADNIDLTGWILSIQDKKDIALSGGIPANSYYLIERTDDDTVPNIAADLISSFGTGLANSGAILILKNNSGSEIDRIDASAGWPAGDNITKQTMQWSGSAWITADATSKALNVGLSQGSQPPSQESQPQTQQSSTSGGGGSTYIPPEKLPHIKVSAGLDKNVVVGALSEFRGQAFGLENEPLENARYLWVFGDGSMREGQNISYFYQYPGEYIVALNVDSGEYSASDYLLVKAVPNQFFISEIKPGENGWIEFENKSKEEIDISGCQIKQGSLPAGEAGQTFTFPPSTKVKSGAFLVVPTSVSKINFSGNGGIVEFFYPGGFSADSFGYEGFISESQSYNRGTGMALIATQSPSAKNSVYVASVPKNSASPADKNLNPAPKSADVLSANENTIATNTNPAAIVIGQPGNAENKALIYLAAAFGAAICAVAAFLLIRRKRGGEHFS